MTDRGIPEPVKRTVRQKCGFGCVLCGLPIFDYDHVENFAEVQEHDPANLVLLCPLHHAEKTRGRLGVDAVRRAAANPMNLNKESTTPHIHTMVGDTSLFDAGGNKFEYSFSKVGDRFDAIVIENQTVLGLSREDGNLLLDISLTDQVATEIFTVSRGELTVSTGVWDFHVEGTTFTINSGARQISVELDMGPEGVAVRRGTFYKPPHELRIFKDRYEVFRDGRRLTTIRGGYSTDPIGLIVH